jgi:hypothetical protein
MPSWLLWLLTSHHGSFHLTPPTIQRTTQSKKPTDNEDAYRRILYLEKNFGKNSHYELNWIDLLKLYEIAEFYQVDLKIDSF